MNNKLPKNTLIGMTSADTLANLSDIVMLLRCLNFDGDINENAEQGLFSIHALIHDSLEYEIHRIKHNEKPCSLKNPKKQ